LLKQYGQELIDDPRRTEALLRDHCGQHTREIFVLVNAQKQRVPNDLLSAPAWMPRQATYSRLSRLLQTKLAITEDAADWAVASWAAALDIDSLPKGDAWSWLPGKARTPPPNSGRKPRTKKRQNTPSSVQYGKSNTRSASRQARARAARAELGWRWPTLGFSRLLQLAKRPALLTNVLPWVALLAATVFLLAVVYWTSSTRSVREMINDVDGVTTPAAGENVAAQTEANPVPTNVTPLPDLPALPSEYLSMIVPLPAWANVSEVAVTLYVREQPALESNVLDFLPAGEPVEVVAFSADGRWSQIERPRMGWVSNDFLLFQSQDATLSSIQLNVEQRRAQRYEVAVRAAPTVNADVTTTLSPDEPVIVAATTGEPANWYQIADPVIGWVAANDLAAPTP
jgi:uncharacterized protein YgiM (DUF1202 family)